MLNTKYLLSGDLQNPIPQINPNANGNAWFIADIQFVDTPNQEIKAIGEIDSKNTAVVLAEDRAYFNGKTLQKDSTATIDLMQYKPNELIFKSNSKTEQLAVFSEVFYPKGWKFFIDNQEVNYIKANYFLRAVAVPAGIHEIRMIFEPEVISTGKIISSIAFGLFILLSLGGIIFNFKKKKWSI